MTSPDSVIRELWRRERGRTHQIYALLDAARDEAIYPALMDFRGEHCCLYGERIPEVLAKASPHLVRLGERDAFTNWLIEEGWGNNWGIFADSGSDMEQLRRHFRKFLKVKTEAGEELFFRYYDPRVLRVYLPTCNETEAGTFFGPVRSFIIEGEDPNDLLKYSHSYAGWTYDSITLS